MQCHWQIEPPQSIRIEKKGRGGGVKCSRLVLFQSPESLSVVKLTVQCSWGPVIRECGCMVSKIRFAPDSASRAWRSHERRSPRQKQNRRDGMVQVSRSLGRLTDSSVCLVWTLNTVISAHGDQTFTLLAVVVLYTRLSR